ncbi:hypothetical protein KFK09_014404 [Dendrobium nobile]|uniref:Uncharacterized protein n=1 Tax=Dendrobium nobile TaxID=94219 RepID=A0A8T3B212_DENNO|nr:hypothetical protein KFK09_014404 [Dendrobium nobile]
MMMIYNLAIGCIWLLWNISIFCGNDVACLDGLIFSSNHNCHYHGDSCTTIGRKLLDLSYFMIFTVISALVFLLVLHSSFLFWNVVLLGSRYYTMCNVVG